MKPLGTNSAVENGLTTPKSVFGKPISQYGLSTKLLKPRGTYNTREDDFSASRSAFEPQTHWAELQPRTDARLPCFVSAKEQKAAWTLAKLWI
ncbi:hypothetical protein [Vibrio kanaloae]|uniref:hypothetical protein n=1 Tax=Vibrio kanaloae TaxID=170673 RepID=UPI00148D714E|nr:hypothetical protein [Vibrio kanaloae]